LSVVTSAGAVVSDVSAGAAVVSDVSAGATVVSDVADVSGAFDVSVSVVEQAANQQATRATTIRIAKNFFIELSSYILYWFYISVQHHIFILHNIQSHYNLLPNFCQEIIGI